MEAGILLVFAIVFLLSYLVLGWQKNLPPGPLGLPVIGSVRIMRDVKKTRPHLLMQELAKEYGPVFSFRLGKQLIVVLNGYDSIHEALVKKSDIFSDRATHLSAFKELLKDGSGVVLNNYNHNWKVLRRFTLQALRDFGVGKSSLEEKIATEIEATSKRFIELGDEPVDINTSMQNLIGNVIFGIVFGVRYGYDDPEFSNVRLMTNTAVTGDGAFNLAFYLSKPIVSLINRFSRQITQEERRTNFHRIDRFLKDNIAQHEATFDENIIRDFVDLHIKTSRDHSNDDETDFTKGNLTRVIRDLFIAGAETTSTSLDWAFLYMAEYPDVQRKCQEEIEEVFGDKAIQYADRDKLTYLNATLMEIQRISVIAPLSLMHSVKADTVLYGYTIPANTNVVPNLYSACMDEKYWTEPHTFMPDRFINERGKLIKVDAFIPFSTGPRQCLGEPLAKMELFLIFANMLQRFSFLRQDDSVKHSLKSRMFFLTNSPESYKLRVKSRK